MSSEDHLAAYASLAQSSPSRALDQLNDFLDAPVALADHGLRAKLNRLGALAARNTNELARSNTLLDQATVDARRDRDPRIAVEIDLTRSYNLFLAGDSRAALELVGSLDSGDDVELQATIEFQHATILARTGERDRAGELFEKAGRLAESVGFSHLRANVSKNLGMMAVEAGDHGRARRHLLDARRRFGELGLPYEVAFADHNLGLAAAALGDLPTAFDHFERAETQLRQLGVSDFESKSGRCRALMAAGLFREAADIAGSAARKCLDAGLEADAAELWVLESESLSAIGRFEEAAARARLASAAFRSQGRTDRGASADLLLAEIEYQTGRPPPREEIDRIAGEIGRGGLQRNWIAARLLGAQLDALAGDHHASQAARDGLRPLVESGPTDLRIAAATCDAFCLRHEDRTAEAQAAARDGYRLLAEEQAVLCAADLRVGLRHHAGRLASMGLEMAMADGRSEPVFWWLESINTTTATPPPVRPPADSALGAELARLRSLGPDRDHERRIIEDTVRDLDRRLRADGGRALHVWPAAALADELGDARGLSIGLVSGHLVGCLVGGDGLTVETLGPADEVARMIRALRSDLRTRAANPGRARPERIGRALARLDELLLGPFDTGGAPLVVTAPPALLSFAWASLPSRRELPTIGAASLTAWAIAERPTYGPPVLAAGPGLSQADAEVVALATGVGSSPARCLRGPSATVAGVRSALDGASIAHIVAHGTVRTDNPLFSSLRMADGELSVYELGDLERAPGIVVLSACHVGLPADAPGQELLGMVTGFLNAGTSCVIASTLPVPDSRSTIDIMTRLHRFLARGMSPAVAWAEVQRTCPDDAQLLDTASFTVFGRG